MFFSKYYEITKLLLENGADIHADDDCALRWASFSGHLKVIKILLENGANVYSENEWPGKIGKYKG